jgi:cytochrome c-type biogenesis protein CcmF
MGYKPIENGKKYAFDIKVEKGSSSSTVSPVMYVSSFNNSLMREPSIWNMLTRDFYITPISYEDGQSSSHSHAAGKAVTLKKGESVDHKGNKIIFDNFNFPPESMSAMMGGGAFEIGANLTVDAYGKTYKIEPKMKSDGNGREFISASVEDLDLLVEMSNLDASGSINLILKSLSGDDETEVSAGSEILSIEASIKPFINLVWTGVLLMVIGFIISTVKRTKDT